MNGVRWTEALEGLEREVERALVTGDHSHLEVLGYGEISSVLALETSAGRMACKRLPLFDGLERYRAYTETFDTYIGQLKEVGVEVVPSRLVSVWREDERLAGYVVQPALSRETLLPNVMRTASLEESLEVLDSVLETVLGAVSPHLGLDAQISNWTWEAGELSYLDVTTPMVRDVDGEESLDKELFLASLPWAIRGVVMRFVLQSILDTYYEPRGVILDLLGNLIKEQLGERLEAYVERANASTGMGFSVTEVQRYYREDAWTWEALLRLRRADRWWQRKVRRRPYPFLLPGQIER